MPGHACSCVCGVLVCVRGCTRCGTWVCGVGQGLRCVHGWVKGEPAWLQPNRLRQLIIPRPQPALWHGPKLSPRHRHRHPPGQRGRRHTGVRLHHAQPLRVGCVLGTCQVQNLSHRLWQLMGRPGRQDSSPMNPNSPHSYG
uniref:ADM2 n=1 Tax=Pavo cristatus TaxID=9049 RepID=A0A8C9EXJ8_PAVCR